MKEIFLEEPDEERLTQNALQHVLLAAVAELVRSSDDPIDALGRIRSMSAQLAALGNHSDDDATNEYAKRFVAARSEHYLDQIKLERT